MPSRFSGRYRDRARALSFGTVAALYDRCRPLYPDALIDTLIARHPADALDVGCGTGQVARALLRRGVTVLGIDPDPQMAAIGQRYGVPIEIATFEAWDDKGRRFDLITAGASQHWIDPMAGLATAARLLRPGGTLARFWTYEVPDEPARGAIRAVYEQLAPDTAPYVPGPPNDWEDPAEGDPAFSSIETTIFPRSRLFDADTWVGMVTTFSDHQRLDPERLAALQAALKEAIVALGGTVHATGGTFARFARRA